MKTYLPILLVFCFFSCVENEDPDAMRSDENLAEALISSAWRVTLFLEDGIDETSDFEGISLTFLANNQVEAYRGTQLLDSGSWETSFDDGRVEFEMSFSEDSVVEELSDDWYQIRLFGNRLSLRENDNTSEDLLTLEKV